MFYLIGLAIAFFAIVGSVLHLNQTLSTYFDLVAALVVLGGTTATAVIILPWEHGEEIRRIVKNLLSRGVRDRKGLAQDCAKIVSTAQSGTPATEYSAAGPAGDVLRDGAELIWLGFKTEKIENILQERLHQTSERSLRVAQSVRSLAKYPPAFGLMGTVLGLVSLMRAISDGAGSQETGTRMAVALVATMYGLIVANLIVNPAGEYIIKTLTEDKIDAELAIESVLLASERTSLLEAQEMINSFLPRKDRTSLISGFDDEKQDAA